MEKVARQNGDDVPAVNMSWGKEKGSGLFNGLVMVIKPDPFLFLCLIKRRGHIMQISLKLLVSGVVTFVAISSGAMAPLWSTQSQSAEGLPLPEKSARVLASQSELANKQKDTKGPIEIPLASVYFTDMQKGLQWTGRRELDQNCMHALDELSRPWGPSNTFLVRANSIGEAVRATWQVMNARATVDEPAAERDSKSDSHWVVAYFGVAEGSNAWEIKSVGLNEQVIRFSYRKPQRLLTSRLINTYLASRPLGRLQPGVYPVELFNDETKTVVLSRRVSVPAK